MTPTPPLSPIESGASHATGNLLMHATNWGISGSMPAGGYPFSDAPSAEWPAGSGNEYLFAGGIWVGAIRNGVPAVSTSLFEMEFRPAPSPIDIVYRSAEGDPRGLRNPSPNADDDHDGRVDELREWRAPVILRSGRR